MNKIISIFIITAVFALGLSSCADSDDRTVLSAEGNAEAVKETIATPAEYTLPEGEGVDDIPVETVEVLTENEDTVGSAEPTVSKESHNAMKPNSEANPESENTTEPVSPLGPSIPAESLPTGAIPEEREECGCAYSAYLLMTPAEQQDYMNSFDSPMAFIDWCRTAEQEHEAHNSTVVVSGGDLDVGDFID